MSTALAKFQNIGTVYLVSGIVNLLGGWWCGAAVLSTVGGFCTSTLSFGLCPIGTLCGAFSLLLLPLGVAEVVIGASILMREDPRGLSTAAKLLPLFELPSLLFGGLVSAVAGGVAWSMLGEDEVAAYIAVRE